MCISFHENIAVATLRRKFAMTKIRQPDGGGAAPKNVQAIIGRHWWCGLVWCWQEPGNDDDGSSDVCTEETQTECVSS